MMRKTKIFRSVGVFRVPNVPFFYFVGQKDVSPNHTTYARLGSHFTIRSKIVDHPTMEWRTDDNLEPQLGC